MVNQILNKIIYTDEEGNAKQIDFEDGLEIKGIIKNAENEETSEVVKQQSINVEADEEAAKAAAKAAAEAAAEAAAAKGGAKMRSKKGMKKSRKGGKRKLRKSRKNKM